jgi:WD40 repeat protein
MLWDLIQHKKFELDVATDYGLAFTDDNKLLVGENDGKFSIWNLATQQMLQRFTAHDSYIQKVEFIGNSRAFSASDKHLKLWDIKNGKLLKSYEATNFIQSFTISKKNDLIILCLSEGNNLTLDLKSLAVKDQWKGTSTASKVVLSQDETKFAIGQSDGGIIVYDTETNKQLSEFKDPDGSIATLSFNQSGNAIISSTSANAYTVKFWDVQTNSKTLSLHEFPDISYIMPIGKDKELALVDKHGKVYMIRY